MYQILYNLIQSLGEKCTEMDHHKDQRVNRKQNKLEGLVVVENTHTNHKRPKRYRNGSQYVLLKTQDINMITEESREMERALRVTGPPTKPSVTNQYSRK